MKTETNEKSFDVKGLDGGEAPVWRSRIFWAPNVGPPTERSLARPVSPAACPSGRLNRTPRRGIVEAGKTNRLATRTHVAVARRFSFAGRGGRAVDCTGLRIR